MPSLYLKCYGNTFLVYTHPPTWYILRTMKILIQRVKKASVVVEGTVVGSIEGGVVVFLGITHTDTPLHADWLVNKLINLRIFEDNVGKMNMSLLDQKGSALIVSQFTLYGDCAAGRRPSFTQAAPPEVATPLYEYFIESMKKAGIPTETGVFGAYMQVSLVNDGPVTLLIEK